MSYDTIDHNIQTEPHEEPGIIAMSSLPLLALLSVLVLIINTI